METNQEIFIQSIKINEVRHLHDVEVALHQDKRTHLILTGKNGSGKTSVLEAMGEFFSFIFDHEVIGKNRVNKIEETYGKHFHRIPQKDHKNEYPFGMGEDMYGLGYSAKELLGYFFKDIDIPFSNPIEYIIDEVLNDFPFIIFLFDLKRILYNGKEIFNIPSKIEKLALPKFNYISMQDNLGVNFIQHIVNLKADRSFAKDDNDTATVEALDAWFSRFENSLKLIFEDESLSLDFDRKTYNFYVTQQNRPKVTFNELSDGYASILRIVSELMMRMEASEQKDYNTQGIVLIDEIEAHLHIDLQKKILPFLTSLFPRLQFIVTTHSPFVLSSLDNAVVFDLEKKIRVENLSGYAVDGIIESYFDTDKYSNLIKRQVSRYETLLQKASPTEDEQAEIYEIKQILQRVPLELAPELVEKFEELELNAILK
ncbi:MAG: hypothetical protein EAZ95_00870 [Bacteroidetes bacterium]|nr:MAG: hypothetical protein EAZ95_00870 [Bacteroidota bacterium]